MKTLHLSDLKLSDHTVLVFQSFTKQSSIETLVIMAHTQTLLQAMMWKQCLSSTEFRNLIVRIMQYDEQSQITNEKLSEVVSAVNEKIKPFNMMIRSSVCEVTREAYYSLISTIDNEVTRMATFHTPKEYEYFRLLLKKLIEDGKLPMREAKQLSKGFLLGQKKPEDILEEWTRKRWFVSIQEDDVKYIVQGPRCSAELDVLMPML